MSSDSLDLVDLQFHTSFPGADPFNAQEPFVPSARLLYYGLMDVPYTILNGGTDPSYWFDHDASKLSWKPIRYESLVFAKFRIKLYSELINNNALYVTAWVTALTDMPAREYTVHVGVVESKITGETGTNGEKVFENVVKAFLPDPAGNTLSRAWSTNDVDTVNNYWYLQNVYNMNELKVFAFIQNESTSEIYQVALNKIDFVTDLKDLPVSENQLLVYPNPANNSIFVKLDKPSKGTVSLNIYSNLGVLVKSMEIPGTADRTEISTSLFPDGIYIIRALSGTSVLGTQKLNVSH